MASADALLDSQSAPALAAAAATPSTPLSPAAAACTAAPVSASEPSATKRRARGKNFTAQEDLRLCAAWLRVSSSFRPSSDGDQQQQHRDDSASFWERAYDVFNGDGCAARSGDAGLRSYQSLQSRWSALQVTIATFGEVYEQVRHELGGGGTGAASTTDVQSGGEEHLIQETRRRFAERQSKRANFSLEPCWQLLRSTPQWLKYVALGSTKGNWRPSGRAATTSATPSSPSKKKRERRSGSTIEHGDGARMRSDASKKRRAVKTPGTQDGDAGSSLSTTAAAVIQSEQSTTSEVLTSAASVADSTDPIAAQAHHSSPQPQPPPPVTSSAVAVRNEPQAAPPASQPQQQSVANGGGFLSAFSPPMAFTSDGDQVVQWTVRENRALPASALAPEATAAAGVDECGRSFALFDDNRRIETLVSGVYALNLYLEPQRAGDASKYYLEINGNAVAAFREASRGDDSRRSSLQAVPASVSADADDRAIPFKTANVAQVQLGKWDMLALRRCAGANDETPGGKTPFARLIIEFVRNG